MGKHDSISGYTAHWGEQKWASPMYNTHTNHNNNKKQKKRTSVSIVALTIAKFDSSQVHSFFIFMRISSNG
jgi:hypothetical protein